MNDRDTRIIGNVLSAISPNTEPAVSNIVNVPLVLTNGELAASQIFSFSGLRDGREHFAIKLGNPHPETPVVRLHSECVTGDVMGSARCDCGPQLNEALLRLHEEGGFLLYMRQEGRGIGLYKKLEAYRLQEDGYDTYTANRMLGHADDERDYGAAVDMLNALGVKRLVLLSNNPDKRAQLLKAGIQVDSLIPTGVFLHAHNRRYLEAKVNHTRHNIDLPAHQESI
ncbi:MULTISPECIES: GTP cyclohydrolase II RibA [Paraburkholderia]|uniref:GTP cyclohydrolase II RibA n=1 Tax=Paraburkholderia TaxID=1822464 RepID=UPI00225B383A|nr:MULTISPECIES: GTP cyclohydrolase II RibA [Paraburkholderia]MCX4162805.1 GTP cyclohydrolase II RibA [Paraburkholderia megapolitana]MDN7158300.1 GTP cyclohydrolase II RibA [Paraburkholderia sp. CHISQ3]MDQ6495347.1 GTP cyclohydrolase II RibA [Paraburkholderia megapolitana]